MTVLKGVTGLAGIAGGITWGFVLGLSPFLSLQGFLLFFGLFIFRFSWVASILSTVFFAGVAYLCAPLFHHMGEAILNIEALEGVFTFFYNSPLIPYTDFNNTVVMGAGVCAIFLAPVVFFLSRILAAKYLKNFHNPPQTTGLTPLKRSMSFLRLRWMISLLVVGALVTVYVIFFLDSHLRRGVQWAGTYIYGAEINVEELDISFSQGRFVLKNLQLTDKANPLRNLIQLEEVELQFVRDALWRKKLVVNHSTVGGIQILAPREKEGKVLASGSNSAFSFLDGSKGGATQWIQALDNPGELVKMKETPLKSDEQVAELKKSLKEKEKKWSAQLKEVPKLEENINKAKKIRFDKDPLKALKEAKSLYLDSRKELKSHKKIYNRIREEIKGLKSAFNRLEASAQEDVEKLKKDLKAPPNLTLLALSTYLFGSLIQQSVAVIRGYMEMARQYMPPPTPEGVAKGGSSSGASPEEGLTEGSAEKGFLESAVNEKSKNGSLTQKVSPGQGKNIAFPITHYPVFWIKEVQLSSQVGDSASESVVGEIKDVTSHPGLVGRPALLRLRGDFPKQSIMGVLVEVTVDHTTSRPSEKLEVHVDSYPVGVQELVKQKHLRLRLTEATGLTRLKAHFEGEMMDVQIENRFKDFLYEMESSSETVKRIVSEALKDTSQIYINGGASGKNWEELKWNFDSNLSKILSESFRDQMERKLKESHLKLKEHIYKKTKAHKRELLKELNKIKDSLIK